MLLYNIGIWLFGSVLNLGALFKPKARLRKSGLKGIFDNLREQISTSDRIAWVHCASLGEFEQGRPIIEGIRERYPEYKILLTFFSPSGYEIRKNYKGADFVHYLPIDSPRNARRFVRIAHPEIAIFIKYEFWLNYLRRLSKAGSRIFLVSAIFNRHQIFFKWYGWAFRRGLRRFEHLFIQNTESRMLLEGIGITNVTIAGDTRFDRVAAVADNALDIAAVEAFTGESRLLVAGSTWPADEHVIMEMIRLQPGLKFVIAPHEMDQERIDRFIAQSPRKAVRYTEWERSDKNAEVMIIDTIGILSSVYRYGAYAYIGGGFGSGIHNTLEAAAFGIPVAFGPNYHKFKEAYDLINAGAAISIDEESELDEWIAAMEQNPTLYQSRCALAKEYIYQNRGAAGKILEQIRPAR